MLDEFDVNATFFVVADVVEHYPGLVESIAERGHESGSHGLHHACKIDPKTKEPLVSVKGDESYDAPDEEVASGKMNRYFTEDRKVEVPIVILTKSKDVKNAF